MKIYAFIFARGGSKGLPRKNILPLKGLPLIAHSINTAKKIKEIDKIFVSTDDTEIANISKIYGAYIINRPKNLASDNSSEWDAWKHAVKWVEKKYGNFDIFLSLPATSPLRSCDDVKNCLNRLDDNLDIVITTTPAKRNPWFNMVSKNKSGEVSLAFKGKKIVRRQDAPELFDICTIAYVTRPSHIIRSKGLWDGKVGDVSIDPRRSIDIDTELDFEIASLLINNN
tara:strand:+ start:669 stop:1349 length:681 start_codon:yes stop_codon:yes gene_type:complete